MDPFSSKKSRRRCTKGIHSCRSLPVLGKTLRESDRSSQNAGEKGNKHPNISKLNQGLDPTGFGLRFMNRQFHILQQCQGTMILHADKINLGSLRFLSNLGVDILKDSYHSAHWSLKGSQPSLCDKLHQFNIAVHGKVACVDVLCLSSA